MTPTVLGEYEPLIGSAAVARIRKKAEPLRGKKLLDVNSALTGGGVAELLVTQTELLQDLGIEAERHVITAPREFFAVTKRIHNALQGDAKGLSEKDKRLYETTAAELAAELPRGHDLVTVHDPQPLALVTHIEKREEPWMWRCHVELSAPNPKVWQVLEPHIEQYDAMVVSLPEYRQEVAVPQVVMMPAIDPFSERQAAMAESEIDARLERYGVPTDRPLVVQVSRFDRWKDPAGVIKAFKGIQTQTEAVLVLLGNFVVDDPESEELYRKLASEDSRILVLSAGDDPELVSALQWRATVVVQKSLREAFGLTVSEAMWRKQPVIGGDTLGIRAQITDGEDGFIVGSPAEAGKRMLELLEDPKLRERLGERAHETVRQQFLFPRLLEQQLDLYTELLSR